MTLNVRYFAVLRDRAGRGKEEVVTNALTARALVDELILIRKLGLPSPLIRIAINGVFAEDSTPLAEGDEVVLLPPVAGG